MRRRAGLIAVVGAAAVLALWAAPAAAASSPVAALAARFAPVIRLVGAPAECGPGEPYVPTDVKLLFGNSEVGLRGPWGGGDLVKVAPSAADVGRGLFGYHLDFPGDALDPGCGYIDWSRRLNAGRPPTVYAHVATDPGYPGQIALQYWMFYVYNDWNNLHEGDWEMIQLNFRAPTAEAALTAHPYEVGYSQHTGGEKAEWGDTKLEILHATHPVVYPAAGSHANFFGSALYLGSSGEQGVGCDDTRNADLQITPQVDTIPSDATEARAADPWIAFQGYWGERQPGFFNGPTGPNMKAQWTHPIAWSQDWRSRAYAVPAGGVLGTDTTDFFCGAMRSGSRLLWIAISHPGATTVALLALLAALVWGLTRATWTPATPIHVGCRRSWGQVLSSSARMYAGHLRLFVGIGLLLIPISIAITGLQALVFGASSLAGVEVEGESAGVMAFVLVAIGTALTLLGLGMVQAATARAMVELDGRREVGPLAAYRLALGSLRPLLGAVIVAVLVVSVLLIPLVLWPVAIWLAVRWALIVPIVELENERALGALGRSRRLARGGWLKIGSLTIVAAAIALIAGPLVGTLLIVLTDLPLAALNLVAGVIYAITLPFVALTTSYVYFDARVRERLAPPGGPGGDRPAEIEL